jgi:FlaA1/EpsC-like NDP-sugar epimerase
VLGSHTIADIAAESKCEAFVMVSTDKAVNPSSVMGATKRIAECYTQLMAAKHPETRFITVRFGNVLGSSGSVVPIFKAQIEAGGPVMVTHPDMTRFFMTIPEAARLLLQASAYGETGSILVLDMGESVKILDLARNMITLSGYEPEVDIQIKFSGIRPGEKIFEELSFDNETTEVTQHPKIRNTKTPLPPSNFLHRILVLENIKADAEPSLLKQELNNLIPEATLKV